MAETVKQLKAELAQEKATSNALKESLDRAGGNKIPTAESLKKKKSGVQLTRQQSLRVDLEVALGMGKTKIGVIISSLKDMIEDGLDPQEEMAAGNAPELRYLVALEFELRKYVKRGKRKERTEKGIGARMKKIKGGYCKGLSKQFKEFAKMLLELMGRDIKKPKWDERIPVPGHKRLDVNG